MACGWVGTSKSFFKDTETPSRHLKCYQVAKRHAPQLTLQILDVNIIVYY